jgi:hypothetical protein
MAVKNWPSKVTWSKFKKLKTRPRGFKEDARIEGTWVGSGFRPTKEGSRWKLSGIDLLLKVDRKQTWVVRGTPSKYLLQHEQGHWDILGLIAREYHGALEALRADDHTEFGDLVGDEEARFQAKGDRLEERYDKETKHSLDKAAQARWTKRIAELMKSGKHLPDK